MLETSTTSTQDRFLRYLAGALAVLGVVVGFLLLIGLLPAAPALQVNGMAVPVVSLGAGAAIGWYGLRTVGRERWAWWLIGVGVGFWGLGELVWQYYAVVLDAEVPYPGLADIFYVSGYPLMFAGVLVMPHRRHEHLARLRLSLDAIAGSVALVVLSWVTYLDELVSFDSELSLLENAINAGYVFGDLFILIPVVILTTRRTVLRFDFRLIAVAIGLVLTAVADVAYVIQVESGTYTSGGRLDGVWLLAYAALAMVAWAGTLRLELREQVNRPPSAWYSLVPYLIVSALFVYAMLYVTKSGSDAHGVVLQFGSGVVGALIIFRQWVSIRENRAAVERQRTDLVGSISHELRTPLTAISGFISLLNDGKDDIDPEERNELIAIVDQQARHLSRIVTDLVDVARGNLENTHLDIIEYDLEDMIDHAISMVRGLDDGSHTIRKQIEGPVVIAVDRVRMAQVLVNLLSNAIRYGNGAIEVHTKSVGGRISIEVHDDGPGVARKYEVDIFNRFERGQHRFDAQIPGSGIGLAVAKSLVTAHHGRIWYQPSNLLGGACFTVELPTPSSDMPAIIPLVTRVDPGVSGQPINLTSTSPSR